MRVVAFVRAGCRPRLPGARIGGPSLRAKLVLLVACAALAPAALVGVASYITVRTLQAGEVAGRLGERAAGAELQVSRFLEARRIATRAAAGSKTLAEELERWERARLVEDSAAAAGARERLERHLSSLRQHDAGHEGLALLDRKGALIAATAPTAFWSPGDAALRLPTGDILIRGSGRAAVVHLERTIREPGGGVAARLRSAGSLESLWRGLASAYDQIPTRLRIVNGRRQTLFDSAVYPRSAPAALPPAVADQLLDLRVGHAAYADENGVEVAAAHRFMPSLDFGALIELPAAEASVTSRRLLDFTLPGSLATVALLAALGCALALHLTRPLRSLLGGLEQARAGDLSHRIPVAVTDEVGAATVAVNQMLDALEKSSRKLERLASTDELTGLYNRRHLDEMFEVELSRASRSLTPLSVLMIDLDRFAAFNDRFGRARGDAFLQQVASFLKTWLRATDLVARYGGEEFAALLPDTDRERAIAIAERLRVRFAASHPGPDDADLPVTLSIGVASWPGGAEVEADLIQAADRALGNAKRNGRNQVRVAA